MIVVHLFSAFIAPLADVVDSFHISHHQYADDTNLYHFFSASDQQSCLESVSECLNSVNNWFLTNGLLVNPGKSDSIFIGTSVQTRKVESSGVGMGGSKIPLSENSKSPGVVFDQRLTFEKHVKAVCRTCYFHKESTNVASILGYWYCGNYWSLDHIVPKPLIPFVIPH